MAADGIREDHHLPKDYIELLIIGSDGIRRKFVGYGELVEVDNIEPLHTLMVVKGYETPIIDLVNGQAVARLQLGDTVEVYAHVRRPHAGMPHKMIAVGEWKGHYVAEHSIERALPATKPSVAIEDEAQQV